VTPHDSEEERELVPEPALEAFASP
jgi:hypothetical protein